MGHCPYCGKALEELCSFCPYCGKQLPSQPKPADQTVSTHKTPVSFSPKKMLLMGLPVVIILALVLMLTRSGKPFSEDTRAIAQASASVVTIHTYDINNVPLMNGSGFAAIDKGIIVTNYHVIEGDTYRIEAVTESGTVMEADTILCYDAARDIAILKFYDCTLPCLPTTAGMDLERGEPLTAIGSPIGFNNMVSTGVLSQYLENSYAHMWQLLFTTSISHGSSGGALFNDEGNVVGITSGGYEGGNEIYYAVPFIYVQELYDNRSPADEITPAKLWEQSEHGYTVDYVLAFPRQLSGKTIELSGYASAVHHDLYLVTLPNQVLDPKAADLSDLIYDQRKAGISIMCQRESRGSFPEDLAGKYVTLRGKVMVYGENTTGDDVRFIVSEVIESK